MPKQTLIQTDYADPGPIHLQSEAVQDIMGKMPSWTIRWGITFMAVVFGGALIGSYFFKYPDIVPARVTISSVNPPVKIIARSSLPIQKLYVQNNQTVQAGQLLCVLQNTADYRQVQKVQQFCQKVDTATELRSLSLDADFHPHMTLGELQTNYIAVLQSLQSYHFFLAHNSYGSKISHLGAQSLYQNRISDQLSWRDDRLREQLTIQQSRSVADSVLVAELVMSKIEYENSRKELLSQQINKDNNLTSVLQSQLQEKEIQKNIAETNIELQSQENQLQQKIREAAKQFNGAYQQWQQSYVMTAPVSGKVTFFKFWKENQVVQSGEAVMVIAPPPGRLTARGEIGLTGAGKVKPGQKVLIKLFAYPHQEFGSLTGTLSSRSLVSLDSVFAVEIRLDNRLATNAGHVIPEQPQIEGIAEITTENKSVLQRLFENIYGKRNR